MSTIRGLLIIFFSVVGILCLVALVFFLLGYRPYILKTESMEPMYTKGSLCWIDTHVSLDSVTSGDVLVYRSPANSLVLHRLIRILPGSSHDDSSLSVIMQGDANTMKQKMELSSNNFIGKEVFTIPFLGTFVSFLSDGILWLLIGFAFLLSCLCRVFIRRISRKRMA